MRRVLTIARPVLLSTCLLWCEVAASAQSASAPAPPRGNWIGTCSLQHGQGWSFASQALVPVEQADLVFESAAGGISSVTLHAPAGIAGLTPGGALGGLQGSPRSLLDAVVAFDPSKLEGRRAMADDRIASSNVFVARTRSGAFVKLAIVARGTGGDWQRQTVKIAFVHNASEPVFAKAAGEVRSERGVSLDAWQLGETDRQIAIHAGNLDALRTAAEAEGRVCVRLQLRGGAGGGNPRQLAMDGSRNAYLARLASDPIDLRGTIGIDEQGRGHADDLLVPAGKAFVVEAIDFLARVHGDSNGNGAFVLKVGRFPVARYDGGTLQVGGRPLETDLADFVMRHCDCRIVVRAGEERTVFAEIANSSACDVLLRGRWSDAAALTEETAPR